jgi:hypothetical protein
MTIFSLNKEGGATTWCKKPGQIGFAPKASKNRAAAAVFSCPWPRLGALPASKWAGPVGVPAVPVASAQARRPHALVGGCFFRAPHARYNQGSSADLLSLRALKKFS